VAEKETEEQPQVDVSAEKDETPKPEGVVEELDEETQKKYNQDLKLDRLGFLIAVKRDTEKQLDPEAFEAKKAKNEPVFNYDEVFEAASEFTGLSADEYKAAAKQQRAPLANLFQEIAENERPVAEVMKQFKTQDAPWAKTQRQRDMALKLSITTEKGIKRVRSGEKEMSPEERTKTLIRLLKSKDSSNKVRVFIGAPGEGEAEDAVVKPGQIEFKRLEAKADAIFNPELAVDKERAEIWQKHLRELGPKTMGSMIRNTLGEAKFTKMVDAVATYDLNRMSEREGIPRGKPGYEALRAKARKGAIHQAALARAVNKFYPTGFIQYEDIDPEGWLRAQEEIGNKSWLEQAISNAAKVRVEVIGVDPDEVPVYRLDSPMWHMFEMADTPQAMASGVMERLSDDSKDESIWTAIYEGSLEGIRNRRDFLKAAMSSEAMDSGGLMAFAAGSAGITAAVLSPDLFLGVAGTARATKRVSNAIASAANFKRAAPELIEAFGDTAVNLAKTEDILEAAERAVARGDYDEALSIIDEAMEFAGKSDVAISKARSADKKTAQVVDQIDFDISRRIGQKKPEITFTEGKRLAALVPGSFGETAQNIHPSARRVDLRGESLDQLVGFGELLSSKEPLKGLKEAVEFLKSGNVDKAYSVRVREFAGRPFVDKVRENLRKTPLAPDEEGLSDAQRQSVLDLLGFLDDTSSTRMLRDDPAKWQETVTDYVRALKFDDIEVGTKFLDDTQKLFKKTLIDAKKARKSAKLISIDDARDATARAIGAVRANFESRAAASAFVREQVAQKASINAEPLLVKLTDRHKAIGRERLSPESLEFMDEVVRQFPELEGDDALKITRLLDQEMKKLADTRVEGKGSRTVADSFRERFAGLVRGPSESEAKKVVDTKVPPTGKAPEPEPKPKDIETPEARATTKRPTAISRAMEGDVDLAAKVDAELRKLLTPFPEGPIANVPKRRKMPKLKTRASEGAEIGPQATFGAADGGMPARELYDHIHAMESGAEVATFLFKYAKLDSTRAIMRRILPTLRKDPPKFSVVDNLSDSDGILLEDLGAIGWFNPAENSVSLRGANWPKTGLSEEVITHELLHAATAKFVTSSPNKASVKGLKSLNDEVMGILERQLTDLSGVEAQRIQNVISNIKGKPEEFITYAMTNRRFQTILSDIEVAPKKTAWNKFTRLVAKLFGFRGEGETNALARAIVASEKVISDAARFADVSADATPVLKSAAEARAATDLIELSTPFIEDAAQGGGISLRADTAFDSPVLKVDSVEIPTLLRGQGLGVDLYLRALKYAQDQKVGFLSDLTPNAEATRVYGSLEKLGIKFARKPVEDAQGNLVDAFFISPRELAKVDLGAAVLRNSERKLGEQVPLFIKKGPEFAGDPLVVEFLENGQAIIRAVGDTATVEDFVRAIGKIARRDLDEKGMKAVVAWLAAKGIKVGYQGASFTADDVATIERAEDEFAKAFNEYVESGLADKPELIGPFSTVREWVADKYAALKGAEVDGATLDIDSNLKRSLDELLRVPANRVGMPNIVSIAKDALFSPELGGTSVDMIDEIARESFRLGYPISKKDLKKQFTKAVEAYNSGRKEDAVITLPGPISIKGWTASNVKGGKKEFTLDELADIQFSLEQAKRLEVQEVGRIPLGGTEKAIQELTPSEMVDQSVTRSGFGSAMRMMYLGGDAFKDMRGLPPKVRDAIMAGARRVQQAVGDAITLVAEGDIVNLTRLVTGEKGVKFTKGGRAAISAGHDSMASVANMLKRYFESIDKDDLDLLETFIRRVRLVKGPGKTAKVMNDFSPEERGKLSEVFNDIINGPQASRFVSEAFQAAGLKPTRIEPKFFTRPAEGLDPGGLLEILMYYGNVTGRIDAANDGNLTLFSETLKIKGQTVQTSQNTFNGIYQDINQFFADDPRVANRIAILIHGHGTADAAKKDWVKLGIAADEKLATSMRQYIVGEAIDPADAVRVKNAFESLGYNPQVVEGYNLDGIKIYVPEAARRRLSMALSQAQDPDLLKVEGMDTLSALNEIAAVPEKIMSGGGTNSSTALSFALFYRYMKTRMVRGHFVLKSRYFWMNTFDHFNQVATRAGFRTALISTTRMMSQNVLSNPIGQAAVFAARRSGKGESVEAFRQVLQSGGDFGAEWAGKLTRGSKWHIKLNPILEGTDGIVMLGGKPYRNEHIRQIALEAGIFASFDTSQLGTKIQSVGNLFLQTQNKNGRLTQMGKDILGDIKGASEDIAEAWAERERLGCMITLMESGLDPQTAAKISIEALYDYAGSMSKADRNFLLNIFFPFWAFQKNANRQIFDTIFSPEGAYRLGVMRRAYDKGSQYLSYLAYDAYVDENGVATDSLPPGMKETYFAFKEQLQDIYGENGKIPPPIQEQIRLFIAFSQVSFTGGKVIEVDPDIEEQLMDIASVLKGNDGKALGLDRRALAAYYFARPDKSSKATYLRDRLSFDLPYFPEDYEGPEDNFEPPEEFQKGIKAWNDLYRSRSPDAPYFSFFLPETTYAAGFNHFAYLMSAKLLTLQKIEDMGDRWFTDEDDGSEAISPMTPLNALLNPARAPVLSDIQATLGTGGATIPKKVHPDLVRFYDWTNIDLLEIDEKEDLFNLMFQQEEAEREGKEPKALPRKPIRVNVRPGKKYYMMPGVGQMLFINSPLGELNDILLRADKTGAEDAAGMRGEIQRWARLASGLDTRETTRERTAMSEKYRAQEESPAVLKKALSGEDLE